MYRNNKVIRRRSAAFKLKILAALNIGKHTKNVLCKPYGILTTNINQWIKMHNRKDAMNTREKVKIKAKISNIKAVQKEMRHRYNKTQLGLGI
jgi:transposase-like protein